MICPHCQKPIEQRVSPKAITRARALRKQGHSLRDIERQLFAEGMRASFATISRVLAKEKLK
jgi:hypothetical protein